MKKIESRLEEFARIYDCTFSKEKILIDSTILGTEAQVTIMKFQLEHNQTAIDITYEFGNHNLAEFNFDLQPSRQIPEFEVTASDHFLRFLRVSRSIWNIKADNRLTKASINDYLNKSGMTDLSKKVAFIPTIIGKNVHGTFNCNTKFHLGFEYKEESFKENIEFQKILIDKLKEKYCG